MPTLAWITTAGLAMTGLALIGALALAVPDAAFNRIVRPLVALAAGSLLGGALFHLLPESVARLGNGLAVYVGMALGVLTFLVLEQVLDWHHCHRPISAHRPMGLLVLLADAVHNLIGGLAIGAAFVSDVRVGIVTWLVAAAHEVPQELGDFGILVHSGWSRLQALAWNVASASTVLLGGLVAYGLAGRLDVGLLLPFAAGTFVYIALADLVPELTTSPGAHDKAVHTLGFALGLALLAAVAVLAPAGG